VPKQDTLFITTFVVKAKANIRQANINSRWLHCELLSVSDAGIVGQWTRKIFSVIWSLVTEESKKNSPVFNETQNERLTECCDSDSDVW